MENVTVAIQVDDPRPDWVIIVDRVNTVINTFNVVILMLGMGAATYVKEVISNIACREEMNRVNDTNNLLALSTSYLYKCTMALFPLPLPFLSLSFLKNIYYIKQTYTGFDLY